MTQLANSSFTTKLTAMAFSVAFSAACLGSVLGGMQTANTESKQKAALATLRTVTLPTVVVVGHKQPQMNMMARSISTLPGKI